MPHKHTKFQVESNQGAGLASKRNTNRENPREKTHGKIAEIIAKNQGKLRKNRENRLSVYLSHHRRDIAQTFMADSPNDALQTYKVSGRKSPRGRVGGQKKYKSRKKHGKKNAKQKHEKLRKQSRKESRKIEKNCEKNS